MSAPKWVYRGGGRYEYWRPKPHCPTERVYLGRVWPVTRSKSKWWMAEVPGSMEGGPYRLLKDAKAAVATVVAEREAKALGADR